MIRQDYNRVENRRRNVDPRKKQFAEATTKDQAYTHRLNFYTDPPTADITLEQFEQWAIDRLRVLVELEACSYRNRGPQETAAYMKPLLDKYLLLEANSANPSSVSAARAAESQQRLADQRRRDHYSHFILRLAFSSTKDLRMRFAKLETALFKLRWASEDSGERSAFVAGLGRMDWCEDVSAAERDSLRDELEAVLWAAESRAKKVMPSIDDEPWYKVSWERVPELVESRKAFVKAGRAYVPAREQATMVIAEFAQRLEKQLELTARALPRLDEDDRLTPILNHLARFLPDGAYTSSDSALPGADISARTIDSLAGQHFPACASHLHRSLRRDAHLKHYGRFQYSLFLKGIGLSLEESLAFWRSSFHKVTDDTFNKEYRYNIRHVYGDVGGDQNRRGGGYSPSSCQKILLENPPGTGDAHGCPYRHFNMDNLETLLQGMGVNDRSVIRGVKEDKDSQRFHLGCNRVFEFLHKSEIKKAKDEGIMTTAQLETIVHPNEYFKRSYLLKNMGKNPGGDGDVKMEG